MRRSETVTGSPRPGGSTSSNSHLFIFTFISLQETLAVFDAVMSSIEFPG